MLGILWMNIVAFAMPTAAYTNPLAFGTHGPADAAAWLAGFVLVDGKMRGLFSFLFGASALLVAERAEAAGLPAWRVHYARMAWLFVFGMAHLTFVWWGDILHHYALVGCLAFLFRRLEAYKLVIIAGLLLAVELLLVAGLPGGVAAITTTVASGHASHADLATYQDLRDSFGRPGPAALAKDLVLHRGPYGPLLRSQAAEALALPWETLRQVGLETLAYMLLGMAAFRTGLLTGAWPRGDYRRWATIGLAITVVTYLLLAWLMEWAGFAMPAVTLASVVFPVALRPVAIVAWACLIAAAARPGGWWSERFAAAGRMAFSNYLGTSLIATGLFDGWGLGWYGRLSRWQLLPVVLLLWALMLGWSQPWLRRHRFGPLEWLWRSLARGAVQPWRR